MGNRTSIINPDEWYLHPQDVHSWYASGVSQSKLLVLVFFRGSWCPWCETYLREVSRTLAKHVAAAGGTVLAVSSETGEAVERLHMSWGLSFPILSDPQNVLARKYNLVVSKTTSTSYPYGMVQPGVVVLKRGLPLFHWASRPSLKNFSGAKDRPLPVDIWKYIESKLKNKSRPPRIRAFNVKYLKDHYSDVYTTMQQHVKAERVVDLSTFEADADRDASISDI